MGSVSLSIGDGTARFRRAPYLCSSLLTVTMLLSVLATNLLALYAFTRTPAPPPLPSSSPHPAHQNLSLVSEHLSLILRDISSSQRSLSNLERSLVGYDSLNPSLDPSSPPDLTLFLSPLPLPLGPDSKTRISHMTSSVSHLCSKSLHLLHPFMSYQPFHQCPNSSLSLPLLSRACDPLPRRRCLSPRGAARPPPSPLWSGPDAHRFDRLMWIKPRGKNDFLADEVVALARGGLRVGLDLSPRVGDFAARMAERNVTVVGLSADGKLSEIIAGRGLFPLQATAGQRLPFADGVFDIVHAVELDGGGGGSMEGVEFLMFDVDRVMRTGGLFWLDNYWCVDEKRKAAVTALIDRFGYKKLKWVVGEKADTAGGSGKAKVYLSAVLQKPARG